MPLLKPSRTDLIKEPRGSVEDVVGSIIASQVRNLKLTSYLGSSTLQPTCWKKFACSHSRTVWEGGTNRASLLSLLLLLSLNCPLFTQSGAAAAAEITRTLPGHGGGVRRRCGERPISSCLPSISPSRLRSSSRPPLPPPLLALPAKKERKKRARRVERPMNEDHRSSGVRRFLSGLWRTDKIFSTPTRIG